MLSSWIKRHSVVSFILGAVLMLGGGKIGGFIGIIIFIVGAGIIFINKIDGLKKMIDGFHGRRNDD